MIKKTAPYIVFLLFTLLCLRTISFDSDLWYQMLSGRYVLEHLHVPHNEFFVFAGARQEQVFGGWGFGLIHHLAFLVGHDIGPSFLNAIIWGMIATLGYLAFYYHQISSKTPLKTSTLLVIYLTALSAAFYGWHLRVNMRAESTFYLCWFLGVFITEKAIYLKKNNVIFLYLPLLCLVEAYLHTAGFFLLLLYPWVVFRLKSLENKIHYRYLCLSFLAALFIPMANPNGPPQSLLQPMCISSSLMKTFLPSIAPDPCFNALYSSAGSIVNPQGETVALVQLNEYRSIFDASHSMVIFDFYVCTGILLVLFYYAYKLRTPSSFFNTFLALFAFISTVIHARAIGIFSCFILIPLAEALSYLFIRHPLSKKMSYFLCLILSLSCFLKLSYLDGNWGIGFEDEDIKKIANDIKTNSPHGARIVTISNGAFFPYILGETYPVLHSGHELFDNKSSNYSDFLLRTGSLGWEETLLSQKVSHVCLPWVEQKTLGVQPLIVPLLLAQDPYWNLLSIHNECALFVKKSDHIKLSDQALLAKSILYYQTLEQQVRAYFMMSSRPQDQKLLEQIHTTLMSLYSKTSH